MNRILRSEDVLKMSQDELVKALMHGSRFEHVSTANTMQTDLCQCPTFIDEVGRGMGFGIGIGIVGVVTAGLYTLFKKR